MNSDLDYHLSELVHERLPTVEQIKWLLGALCQLLAEEENTVPLRGPVIVVGDVHGQFHDMLEMLCLCEELYPAGEALYCFAGDYVDRGHHSVETFLYLALLKLQRPEAVCLLRGNHETRAINDVYGLYDEVQAKFGDRAWQVYGWLNSAFNLLPLAALIDDRLLVLHGGISPQLDSLDQLQELDRIQEVPRHGLMSDLLWSDPDEDQTERWLASNRGCGYTFSGKALTAFHHTQGTECLARGHQLVERGYRYMFDDQLVTVWSAPNYCYRCGNKAAVLRVDEDGHHSEHLFEPSVMSATVATGQLFVDKYFL